MGSKLNLKELADCKSNLENHRSVLKKLQESANESQAENRQASIVYSEKCKAYETDFICVLTLDFSWKTNSKLLTNKF